MAVTARMGLRYPVSTDSADVPRDIQNLASDVDSKAAIDSQGPLANRPTTGQTGQYYYATDNQLLYRWDGTAWQTINPAGVVDAAPGVGSLRTLGSGANQAAAGNDSRFTPPPIDPAPGTGGSRTLGTGAQQAMAGTDSRVDQPGDLKMTAAIGIQAGYLACDGASYLRATYPNLFAALGGASSTWGVPDGTHFNVPDFRGRSPMGDGQGPGLANRVFGVLAGEDVHVLTIAEIASHSHGGTTGVDSPDHGHNGATDAQGSHTHGMSMQSNTRAGSAGSGVLSNLGGSGVYNAGVGMDAAGSHSHNVSVGGATARHAHGINAEGGGGGHNNVHPVAVVHIFIKT